MPDASPPPNETLILLNALRQPFRRIWWWLICTFAVFGFFAISLFQFSSDRGSHRLWWAWCLCLALIARTYMATVETTLTNYGEESWQADGFAPENKWDALGAIAFVTMIAFAPAVGWHLWGLYQGIEPQPWTSIIAAFGCDYFSMGAVGVAFFGGIQGAAPKVVIPALWRAGRRFTLAGFCLLFVPGLMHSVIVFGQDLGFVWLATVSAAASYLIIAHARLAGLMYQASSDRVGWE